MRPIPFSPVVTLRVLVSDGVDIVSAGFVEFKILGADIPSSCNSLGSPFLEVLDNLTVLKCAARE
jgi:hypothetical protein